MQTKLIRQKRTISPEVQAKGAIALAKWRQEKAAAEKKGGEFFLNWLTEQEIKKQQKATSPMQAIKNFCNACVETREHIKNCTSNTCQIWIYRPYQKDNE